MSEEIKKFSAKGSIYIKSLDSLLEWSKIVITDFEQRNLLRSLGCSSGTIYDGDLNKILSMQDILLKQVLQVQELNNKLQLQNDQLLAMCESRDRQISTLEESMTEINSKINIMFEHVVQKTIIIENSSTPHNNDNSPRKRSSKRIIAHEPQLPISNVTTHNNYSSAFDMLGKKNDCFAFKPIGTLKDLTFEKMLKDYFEYNLKSKGAWCCNERQSRRIMFVVNFALNEVPETATKKDVLFPIIQSKAPDVGSLQYDYWATEFHDHIVLIENNMIDYIKVEERKYLSNDILSKRKGDPKKTICAYEDRIKALVAARAAVKPIGRVSSKA